MATSPSHHIFSKIKHSEDSELAIFWQECSVAYVYTYVHMHVCAYECVCTHVRDKQPLVLCT